MPTPFRIYRLKSSTIKIFSFIILVLPAYTFFSAPPAVFADERNTRIFTEANSFFEQAEAANDPQNSAELYEKALLRYEELGRRIKNGRLYYNIGNAYCGLEDIGRAIVNFRRAEKLSPRDQNIARNLAWALERRQDVISEKDEERLLQTIVRHADLARPAKIFLFSSCYVLCWLGAGLLFFNPLPIPKRLTGLIFALTLCFCVLLGLDHFRQDSAAGVIVAREVTARQGDGAHYQPSFTSPLHAGTEFRLVEQRSDWLRVELRDGRLCWLPAQSCELI